MITNKGLEQLVFEPRSDYSLEDDGNSVFIAKWYSDKPQPTEAEIETAHADWKAEYDATEYKRLRAPEYPPIGDQLDALFHAGVFPEEMAAQLQAVKDKYPK